MDSNERLRSGLAAVANTGLGFAQRKYQIEARTQFEDASTKIAGEIDRFNMDLDRDPDYQSYQEKWAKKQQDLQKYIGGVKNPEAKRELESFLKRTYESQTTVLEGKTAKALLQDTYVTRTNALNNRLEQTAIPTADKMLDIDATVDGLLQDGVVDRVKAQDMKSALASATIGQDLIGRALAVFRDVEAHEGEAAALNAADRYILEFQETYTVGGQTASATIAQKNGAQAAIRDAYNISTREKQAAAEKLYREEDERLYAGFSAFVAGDPRGLTYTAIDRSQLPVERKMYWRNQLEQAENVKARPDGILEAQANDLWNRLNIALTEMKRSGGALSGDQVIQFGDQRFTFRDAQGLQEILRTNYALFNKVYGKQWAGMYEGYIKELDKPTGVVDATRERILTLTKQKKDPMPDWENSQILLLYDAWVKEQGGKVSMEQAEEWFKAAVDRPRLTRTVQQIGHGSWFPDNDDHITRMMADNAFRYDIADGRPMNPLTREALMSFATAVEKEYATAENLSPGTYAVTFSSGATGSRLWITRKRPDGRTENVTPQPFGSKKETRLVRYIYQDNKLVSTEALDPNQKKWLPAQPRLDDPKVWDYTPETRANQASELEAEKRARRGETVMNIDGVGFYLNPALGGF